MRSKTCKQNAISHVNTKDIKINVCVHMQISIMSLNKYPFKMLFACWYNWIKLNLVSHIFQLFHFCAKHCKKKYRLLFVKLHCIFCRIYILINKYLLASEQKVCKRALFSVQQNALEKRIKNANWYKYANNASSLFSFCVLS